MLPQFRVRSNSYIAFACQLRHPRCSRQHKGVAMGSAGRAGTIYSIVLFSFLAAFFLAGCAQPQIVTLTPLPDAEIAHLDEQHLCSAIWAFGTSDVRLLQRAQKAHINCDYDYQACKNSGFKPGTEALATCINGRINQLQQQRALAEQQQYHRQQQYLARRPVTTNCSRFGTAVNCTSY
jgi:hypothetical protein